MPLTPLPLPLGGEGGLGPTEETAKALHFHDPLLIRTGLATKSRAHSHKNMILQRGNLAGLEGACGGKTLPGSFVLFFFISFSFSSFLFTANFLREWVFVFVIKHLRSMTHTIQTGATNPHPWGPSQAGDSGGPPWLLCGCFPCPFPGVWRRWAGVGSWGRWNLYSSYVGRWSQEKIPNKETTKSRVPTKMADDAHEGTWDTVKR